MILGNSLRYSRSGDRAWQATVARAHEPQARGMRSDVTRSKVINKGGVPQQTLDLVHLHTDQINGFWAPPPTRTPEIPESVRIHPL